MSARTCPVCLRESIPVYRAMCRHCFDKVPWKNRADFLHAWRRRVMNPTVYTEELISVRQWYIHSRSPEKVAKNDDDEK